MKIIKISIIMIIFVLPQICLAGDNWYREINSNIEESGMDKFIHVIGGTAISFYTAEYTDLPRPAAALLPTVIGLGKELTDKNFDYNDLSSWAVSGLIGAYVLPGMFVRVEEEKAMVGYTFNW